MAIFEVQGPDGATYEIDAPDEATAMEAFGRMGQPSSPDGAASPAQGSTRQPPRSEGGGPLPAGPMELMQAAGRFGLDRLTGGDKSFGEAVEESASMRDRLLRGATLGASDYLGGAVNYMRGEGGTYDEALRGYRAGLDERAGGVEGTVSEIAGSLAPGSLAGRAVLSAGKAVAPALTKAIFGRSAGTAAGAAGGLGAGAAQGAIENVAGTDKSMAQGALEQGAIGFLGGRAGGKVLDVAGKWGGAVLNKLGMFKGGRDFPTSAQMRQDASDMYTAIRQAGDEIPDRQAHLMHRELIGAMRRANGIAPDGSVSKRVAGLTPVVERLQQWTTRKMPVDATEALDLRATLTEAIRDGSDVESAVGMQLLKQFDNIAMRHIRGWKEANKAWSHAMKSETVDDAIAKAQQLASTRRGSLRDNLRTQFTRLSDQVQKNPSWWSKEEVAAIDAIAKGRRSLDAVADMLSPAGTSGRLTAAGASALGTALTGNPLAGAGVAAAGAGIARGANRAAAGAADEASAAMRSGLSVEEIRRLRNVLPTLLRAGGGVAAGSGARQNSE